MVLQVQGCCQIKAMVVSDNRGICSYLAADCSGSINDSVALKKYGMAHKKVA